MIGRVAHGDRAGGPWRSGWLCLAGFLLLTAVPAAFAGAEREALAARFPELHEAIYDVTVCEYCGLVTPAVAHGFRRQVDALVARDGLSEATFRELRISAWTRADLEWSNRGLGGFRNWCRTEGAAAARRFAAHSAAGASAE